MTTRLQAAAWLIDTTEDRLMSHCDYGSDGLVVIGPDGQKHIFTEEQIKRAMVAMKTPRLAEVVRRGRPSEDARHAEQPAQPEPPMAAKGKARANPVKSTKVITAVRTGQKKQKPKD